MEVSKGKSQGLGYFCTKDKPLDEKNPSQCFALLHQRTQVLTSTAASSRPCQLTTAVCILLCSIVFRADLEIQQYLPLCSEHYRHI